MRGIWTDFKSIMRGLLVVVFYLCNLRLINQYTKTNIVLIIRFFTTICYNLCRYSTSTLFTLWLL